MCDVWLTNENTNDISNEAADSIANSRADQTDCDAHTSSYQADDVADENAYAHADAGAVYMGYW